MMTLIMRFYKAFMYSWNGLKYAWKSQWAFRVEIVILLLAIPCAIIISSTYTDFILMIASLILLPMLELLNSAVETTVNRISLDFHELSGLAKDLASAAMLVAGLNAVFVWGMILATRFFF